MPGKQAKILAANQIDDLLLFAETTRHPLRNRLIVLLSVKAGLRAAELAKLTWDMVLDPHGAVDMVLGLRDCAAKKKAMTNNPSPYRSSRGALRALGKIRALTTCRAFGAGQQDEGAQHRHLV
ncbi:tyrosine-type recombinase/integrase [Bradyrhizobium ottawaense]|uniref:tyrosine-type recombinase/integrase n=1 Tax=Bradyrhizobium ottawaense TaxID=931866 RepID=UPI0036F40AEE